MTNIINIALLLAVWLTLSSIMLYISYTMWKYDFDKNHIKEDKIWVIPVLCIITPLSGIYNVYHLLHYTNILQTFIFSSILGLNIITSIITYSKYENKL